MEPITATTNTPSAEMNWFARLGGAGFLFFLVKGLLWAGVPVLLSLWSTRH